MRKFIVFPAGIALCMMLMGCPRTIPIPPRFEYTSADLQGGWNRLDDFLESPTAGGGDGAGEEPVRELVEPDVIRQSGNVLFVLNQCRGLTLVDMDAQSVLDQVPTLGFPRDVYVVGDRAYVLVGYAADFEQHGDTVSYEIASRLYVVDISDPSDCSIVATFDLEGDLTDSRLVGDVLYAVTSEYDWSWIDAVPVKAKSSASHIVSVNIADEDNIFKADQVSTNSIGDVVYATNEAMFVAGWDWDDNRSVITMIDISDPAGDLQVGDEVEVRGYVADQYKMDVYNEVLRVVSNGWNDGRRTYITTVDVSNPNDLEVLADIEFDRADGETLFATRFDGERGYIVTFFQVDPLFVIDFSDPANPMVAGELEVPGWSTHLEARGDRLIALGVDDTNGWQVSVSLFDVSDPSAPSLVERVSFGQNWSWSSAYEDVKALTVLDDVIIVPFSGWEDVGGGFDRLQFVSWTPDDLTKRGTVDLQGSIIRSFAHAGDYYGLTSEQLAQIDGSDLDQPTVTNTIVLAENIVDFIELSPELGVELVTRYDTGVTTARAVSLPLKNGLGEVDVELGELVGAHRVGDAVVLVGASWDAAAGYTVARVDFSDASDPQLTGELSVDVYPYYGYWWILPLYDGMEGGADGVVPAGGATVSTGGADASVTWWPWFPTYRQDATMVAGDTLALRCVAESYDETVGDDAPQQGLALIDLESFTLSAVVGLGFDAVSSVDAVGDKLYISSKTWVSSGPFPLQQQPLCAYFITEFDPAALDAGPTVNVPGTFVQYDAAGGVLMLRDDQWTNTYEYRSVLRTVSWDGGLGVDEIDNTQLPDGTSVVLGRGAKVFVEAYDDGVRLHTVDVAVSGALQPDDDVLVTKSWGNLIDANADTAYFGIGGAAIARYDCTDGIDLEDLVEVMGAPTRIRFGAERAYAPLGYFGIVQLEL